MHGPASYQFIEGSPMSPQGSGPYSHKGYWEYLWPWSLRVSKSFGNFNLQTTLILSTFPEACGWERQCRFWVRGNTLLSYFIMILMKCVYWLLDIKAGILQAENKIQQFFATIRAITFWLENASSRTENRHTKPINIQILGRMEAG